MNPRCDTKAIDACTQSGLERPLTCQDKVPIQPLADGPGEGINEHLNATPNI